MIHALLNGNLVANNSYNEINQLTNRSFGNTIQLTQEFNANGALMGIHAKKNKQERMHLSYTYDSLNRKTAETDMLNNQNSESYQYDSANRLVNWSRANNKQQSWQLDALANWLSTTANGVTETRQHNNTNAIVSSQKNNQNVTITYDLDGNTSFDGKFYYSSDALNRIISVRDLNQNLIAKYQLDAINRRISKTVENTITSTVYAGWQVAEEQEAVIQGKKTKLTLKVYVYGNYIDEPLVMKHTKPNGNVKQYWYLHNQQYSVYALLNDSGKILETYHYSAYGEPQIETTTGAIIDTSAYDNHYLYTGRLLDQETKLFYFRNRYYHSSQGRFISRDPIGYVDGMSLYRGYFAVNGLDWSGLEEQSDRGRRRTNRRRLTNGSMFDDRGKEIFDHWMGGTGNPIIANEGVWGKYMKDNSLLKKQLKERFLRDCRERTHSDVINRKFHAVIENGYFTGYEMLHGTDRTVGDFSIRGNANIGQSSKGTSIIQYDIEFGWHDKIDPNFSYRLDVFLSKILHIVGSPKNYDIHITWKVSFSCEKCGDKIISTKGYPYE